MPASKEPDKRLFRSFLRFSGRGLSFFFLSAALTVLGILRIDLSMLFWGGAFLFLSVFFAAGNAIESLRFSRFLKSAPNSVSIAFRVEAQAGTYPQSEIVFSVKARLPILIFPGISIEAERTYDSPNGRETLAALRLGAGETRGEIKTEAGKRGRYISSIEGFRVRDILRFTDNFVGKESIDEFFVFPDKADPPLGIDSRRGGESERVRAVFERSEDLFDSRQYVAGDDTRRLDWKRFARHGDFFVRTGEFSPPPDSAYLVTILSERPVLLSEADQADYLDLLCSRCAAFLWWAQNSARTAKFVLPEEGGQRYPETTRAEEAEKALAALAWSKSAKRGQSRDMEGSVTGNGSILDGERRKGTRLVVFAAPGCGSVEALAAEALGKGFGVILLIQDLPPPRAGERVSGWRRALFAAPKAELGPRARLMRGNPAVYRSEFTGLVETDIAKYRGMGGIDAIRI